MSTNTEAPAEERILNAAAQLLTSGGRDAVTARAVSTAAGVQHPTIYRQFGDMQGLLDAVANRGFATYIQAKTSRSTEADPVDDLRRGWDLHVDFGLTNPALYALMYGTPRPGRTLQAAETAAAILRSLIHRVAEHGRLQMDVEPAAQMFGAAGIGIVLSLLALPEAERDLSLSVHARETLIAGITTARTEAHTDTRTDALPSLSGHAIALRARLGEPHGDFSDAEDSLLTEWLARIANATPADQQ